MKHLIFQVGLRFCCGADFFFGLGNLGKLWQLSNFVVEGLLGFVYIFQSKSSQWSLISYVCTFVVPAAEVEGPRLRKQTIKALKILVANLSFRSSWWEPSWFNIPQQCPNNVNLSHSSQQSTTSSRYLTVPLSGNTCMWLYYRGVYCVNQLRFQKI